MKCLIMVVTTQLLLIVLDSTQYNDIIIIAPFTPVFILDVEKSNFFFECF